MNPEVATLMWQQLLGALVMALMFARMGWMVVRPRQARSTAHARKH